VFKNATCVRRTLFLIDNFDPYFHRTVQNHMLVYCHPCSFLLPVFSLNPTNTFLKLFQVFSMKLLHTDFHYYKFILSCDILAVLAEHAVIRTQTVNTQISLWQIREPLLDFAAIISTDCVFVIGFSKFRISYESSLVHIRTLCNIL
jgi:hypothetical protein